MFSMLLLALLVYIAMYVNDQFVRPFLGDVLVVIWLFFVLRAFLRMPDMKLALVVLGIAYLVEISQYFQVIRWLGLSHVKVLSVIFGATFDMADLLAYTLGWLVLVGWILMARKLLQSVRSIQPRIQPRMQQRKQPRD